MSSGDIHLSTIRPSPPEGADFLITIDFIKDAPKPQRVFQAADAMLRALQHLDEILCGSIDSKIEPVLMLEEIEIGSIKIWLRNALGVIDDEALKTLDWKPAVGKYLVRAKYAYIRWSNKADAQCTLSDLSKELRQIAAETDVKILPDYAPPSVSELAEVTQEIQKAKSFLLSGDAISFSEPLGEKVEFDVSVVWTRDELAEMAVKETSKFPEAPMILIVRKPDYLGASQWEFRHGKKTIHAKLLDSVWLGQFHSRQVDVRPGDALKCLVSIEHGYGYDRELLREVYSISRVLDVLEKISQDRLALD